MSYLKPGALAGITSRQVGRSYVDRGLSGITSPQVGRRYVARGLAAAMGDTEPATNLTEEQWRAAMLKEQGRLAIAADRWIEQDRMIRYLQIGATLMIPVAGAVWKFILGRRAVSSSLSL